LRFGNEAARQQAERGRNERSAFKDIVVDGSIGGVHLRVQKGRGCCQYLQEKRALF
jgi:hypothetical protein